MNAPQTLPKPDISHVRRDIDAIDAAIAELIVKRCNLSAAVAAAKTAAGDTSFGWRPAREVEILRTVLNQQASLNPELAFRIWRALISANLAAQGPLSLVTTRALEATAKATFSVAPSPELQPSTQHVLSAVLENDHAIGFLPWPTDDDWWTMLCDPEFAALHVCAATPIAGGDAEALLVSKRRPDPSDDDIILVAGPKGVIDGGVMAQAGKLELVAYGGDFDAEEPLPKGCRWIGSFALV